MSHISRRVSPRIPTEALCTEYIGGSARHALAVDLSDGGLRLIRPYFGGPIERTLQVELELPDADEIVWAMGKVCFDEVRRAPTGGLVRATGIRLAAAARQDLAMVRDWVYAKWRSRESVTPWLAESTAFLRG